MPESETIEIEKKLKQIIDEIFTDMMKIERYAGTAYCTELAEESDAKFFLGQYKALRRTRENIQKHMFTLQIEREEKQDA